MGPVGRGYNYCLPSGSRNSRPTETRPPSPHLRHLAQFGSTSTNGLEVPTRIPGKAGSRLRPHVDNLSFFPRTYHRRDVQETDSERCGDLGGLDRVCSGVYEGAEGPIGW